MNIRELQKELGISNRRDVLALDPGNDPFWDTPSRRSKAEWAKRIFDKYYDGTTLHLRGLHYQMLGQEIPKPWGDESYQNTNSDWAQLKVGFRDARLWGLIPYEGIDDRKNPTPQINDRAFGAACKEWWAGITDLEEWEFELAKPEFRVCSSGHEKPYMIEVWSEKFEPAVDAIAGRFGCNYQIFSGTASLTRIRQLFERAKMAERPLVLLYLADFDPGGDDMPRAMSRSLEYIIRDEGLDYDVQVVHLMITKAQIDEYELPPTPIKSKSGDKKLRKNYLKWNAAYGGQVEITALSALHPQEFEKILVEAISPFTVQSDRPASKIQEWSDEFDRLMADRSDEFDDIESNAESLAERYQELQNELKSELLERTSRHKVGHDAKAIAQDALFDSRRDYVEQINRYKLE